MCHTTMTSQLVCNDSLPFLKLFQSINKKGSKVNHYFFLKSNGLNFDTNGWDNCFNGFRTTIQVYNYFYLGYLKVEVYFSSVKNELLFG